MISKEKFKDIVNRELSSLQVSGILSETDKIESPLKDRICFALTGLTLTLGIISLCIVELSKSNKFSFQLPEESYDKIGFFMLILFIIGGIAYLLYKNKNDINYAKSKKLQQNYEKILLSLGVEKITDKRFKKFAGIPILQAPLVSPAYRIGKFVVQNFIAKGQRKNAYHYDAEVQFFYQETSLTHQYDSFRWRKINDKNLHSPVSKTGNALYEHFINKNHEYRQYADVFGRQRNDMHRIVAEYEFSGFTKKLHPKIIAGWKKNKDKSTSSYAEEYKNNPYTSDFSPILCVDKYAPYHTFLSDEKDEFIDLLYDEIAFLMDLSDKLSSFAQLEFADRYK